MPKARRSEPRSSARGYEVSLTEEILSRLAMPEASEAEDAPTEDRYGLADLQPWLDRIPPLEADIVELTLRGCRQADLATIFDFTQAGISYRLHKAIGRLQFERELENYPSREDMERDLRPIKDIHRKKHGSDLDALLIYYETTCQLTVSARLGYQGLNVGWLRRRLTRYATHLRSLGLGRYSDLIHFLLANQNIRNDIGIWNDERRRRACVPRQMRQRRKHET